MHAKDDDQESQRPEANSEEKTYNQFVALAEVHHRARHVAQLDPDQSTQEHSDRWIKVDNQANRTPPDDDDQPTLKQIEATYMGRKCNFAMRKTNEEGTFTVTGEETKVGVSKTIQGSVNGAWFLDTFDRAKKIVSQAELAEQELIACSKRAINATQEDLTNARMAGPMFVTDGRAHFSYFEHVKDSSLEGMAVNYHIGLVGLTVSAKSPLIDVDPNQHPNEQLQQTWVMAWELKETTNQFWETFLKTVTTAQELSDRCHFLHSGVVTRYTEAQYPESEPGI